MGPKISQEDIDRWNGLSDKTSTLETLLKKLDGEFEVMGTHQKEIQSKMLTFALKEDLSKTNHEV